MSNNQYAIQASELGKCYHIYDKPQDRLKQVFSRKQYYREFWALQNVTFSLEKGESLGIIGRNGSGKSTLLQMLCQTLTPTRGKIETRGRIAALLELGSGFNPEFNGLENIFLNGTILGFTRKEMLAHLDEIIEFADIGDFLHQPVKTYSSGMFVRLAFAVQACIKPDILIVDEALSVGDFFFQQKCAQRMRDLRAQGTTLLFVSHDMSTVRDLCNKALYLKSGEQMFYGPSKDSIKMFFAEGQGTSNQTMPCSNVKSDIHEPTKTSNIITNLSASACWTNPYNEGNGTNAAKILAVNVLDEENTPTLSVIMGNTVKIQVLYQSFSDKPIHVTLTLKNRYNHIIHVSGSYSSNIKTPILKHGELSVCELELKCMLEAGFYSFSISLGQADNLPNRGITFDETPSLGPLAVTWDYENDKAPWFGMFGLPIQTRFIDLNTK